MTRTFNRPLTPATLIRQGLVSERSTDTDLVRGYQYACFTRALAFTVPSLQFYYWTTDHNITLHQVGGQDYIERIRAELQRRGLFDQAEDYHIDFRAMRCWVERKRMPQPLPPEDHASNEIALTDLAVKLYEVMIARYIETGYMYSGSESPNLSLCRAIGIDSTDHLFDFIEELLAAGLIQQRSCGKYSIELPARKRAELILEHGLDKVWQEERSYFHPLAPWGEITQTWKELAEGNEPWAALGRAALALQNTQIHPSKWLEAVVRWREAAPACGLPPDLPHLAQQVLEHLNRRGIQLPLSNSERRLS